MKGPTPREESVLALVLDESRKLQTLSTQAQGCNELDGLVVDLRAAIRGRPGEGVKERKAEVASVAIRLAALAVRFILDLRLDRCLDPAPAPEGCTPIELDRFPVEFEGRRFVATGRLMAREVAPAGGDRLPLILRRELSEPPQGD